MFFNLMSFMMKSKSTLEKVVVIIPTYNEAEGIAATLSAVFDATEVTPGYDVHVLVFDSQSTDATQAIVKQLQHTNDHLHCQTEPQKTGLGSAYWQAMHYALSALSADIVIEFDADLSHQPHYLPPMLACLKSADVVVGSRYVSGGAIPSNWGWNRRWLSALGNFTARAILTPRYKDFTSGFRATRRAFLLKALPKRFLSAQYAYKLELFWRLHRIKARIVEIPITFVDRETGVSKLPANSIMDSLYVLAALRLIDSKRYFKMCLVGLSGAIIQYSVYNGLRGHMPPFNAAKWAVITAVACNFILNNQFTFRRRRMIGWVEKVRSIVLYIGYSVLMVNFQSYWLYFCIMGTGTGLLKENFIILIGMIMGSFLNYLVFSKVIWRKKTVF